MFSKERVETTKELEILLADYWHDVDTNWGRNVGQFYTDDAVFHGKNIYRGKAKIEQFYQYRVDRGARIAVHAICNFRCVVDSPKQATCTWYLILYANDGEPVLPTAPPIQIALMTDTCVKSDDGNWRYQYRRFETLFAGGVATTSPNLDDKPSA